VKAPAFDYLAPASLAEALSALAEHGEGAKLLAGGQSLVPALNLRLLAPEVLIDLNHVPELTGLSFEGDRIRIGALTRHAEIERSALIREHLPLLSDAVRHVAHPAIRTRGTMGGNLAHADPASEFPACMVALGATMIVAGPDGERRVAAEDFFKGVYETALGPDEILVAIDLPAVMTGRSSRHERLRRVDPTTPTREASSPSGRDPRVKPGDDTVWRGDGSRHVFLELARRSGDYALVGLAATATVVEGRFTALCPVFFAAGPHPIVAENAAAALVGQPVDDAALATACAALEHELQPEGDLQISAAMRLHLARTLLRRAVAALLPEAGLGEPGRAAA
jgi:carbon-monoxide dehydrogenase medium subunit